MVLEKFPDPAFLWIILCVSGYNMGFCWGMQQSVNLSQFFGCGPQLNPYNAPPSTRRSGNAAW
ncbi:hypothetical protein FEM41_07095 [Jejubacter calystegiae]|uniref:Uncharacterized protein n=1 Tax=Jejubacter calystegiae TaxID=2579935 RepID=A0A4P8YLR9_9ENTR|nr:hypothetical protein FEM41_07095 [Jejubacter calystegiae]